MSAESTPASSLRLLGGCHLDGLEGAQSAAQVKRLVLLAYLACTTPAPPTRERLCSLFWPELDQASARHALRQALYALRQLVGAEVVRARGQFVTIDVGALAVDVIAFARLVEARRDDEALALYAGDLLDGVHVSGTSPEFESWLDGARHRLRTAAVEAAMRDAEGQAAGGHLAVAERRVRFAESLHPLDELVTRRRMLLLAELGNRGGALDCYAQLTARLRAQLDVEPSEATQALARELSASSPRTPPLREVGRASREAPHVSVAPSPARTAERSTPLDEALPLTREVVSVHAHRAAVDAAPGRPRRGWRRGALATAAAVALVAMGWRGIASGGGPGAAGAASARDLVARGGDAYCGGELDAAASLFAAAVAADSGSATAAYGQAEVARAQGRTAEWAKAMRRALQLTSAPRADDALRLLVRASWAEGTNDRAWLPLSESLAVRHPDVGAGSLAYANALVFRGDFASARAVVRAAARRNSMARSLPVCRGAALASPGITAAILLDSLEVAEREVREWLQRDPTSRDAHFLLATVLQRQGRSADALRARQASLRAASRVIDDAAARAEMALRDGRFAEAERILAVRASDVRPEVRGDAMWWTARLQRERGRARDAVATARALRAVASRDEGPDVALGVAVMQAQALLEAGQARASAQLFDSLAKAPATGLEGELPPGNGLTARRRAWALVHVAAAYAEGGDTLALRSLVDSIRTLGARSAFGRDERLHHHVLGELLVARGDTAAAIRELQLALYSSTEGYSRTSLILGRLLSARHRGAEAATILEAALRAPLDGSALYTTRTELHEALADALALAGRRKEARAHYAVVAEAWRDADPRFSARGRRARRADQALLSPQVKCCPPPICLAHRIAVSGRRYPPHPLTTSRFTTCASIAFGASRMRIMR
ncbi:MAG: BTAD domain-containing putative transcriptional regulator [Gemmatimonadaceae bacterium]